MSGNCGGDAVPLAAIPVPAIRYAVRDGDPVATRVNAAFESAFDASPETSLCEWLAARELVVVDGSVAAVCESLTAGEPVEATVRDARESPRRTYTLRSVDRAASPLTDGGVATLTPQSRTGDADVNRVAQVVSHDLRNPLDVANAHLRAAREQGGEEHFEQVERAHERMERIISDVLTLTCGEEAVTPSATVPLGEVAADAWVSVDTGAATLRVGDDLPTVQADPDRLQRLFENLFRNAVEHGSTGNQNAKRSDDALEHSSTSPRSQAHEDPVEHGSTGSGSPEAGEGVLVRVESTSDGFIVADDGRGVPESDRELVFAPGYSGAEDGAGLGLAIVDRIAAAHGWTAAVTASADGGARFEFRDPDGVNDP